MKNSLNILRALLGAAFVLTVFSSPFLFNSCAPSRVGSKLYPEADYPLSSDTAYSASSDLTLRIPQGWVTAEDKECRCLDLWLIRSDFASSLNLAVLNPDSIFQSHTSEDSLKAALNYSRQLKMNKLADRYKALQEEDEYFSFPPQRFGAYEYQSNDGLPVRVVVFSYRGKYFEFSALPAMPGKADPKELFRIQQSLISTIR